MTEYLLFCKKCLQELPTDYFFDHPNTKTKKQHVCKNCMSKLQSQRFQKKKDEYRERLKAWRATNPEKYKEELERRKAKRKALKEKESGCIQ